MNQEEKDAFYLYVNRRFALLSYLCMAQLGGMFMKAGQYMGQDRCHAACVCKHCKIKRSSTVSRIFKSEKQYAKH